MQQTIPTTIRLLPDEKRTLEQLAAGAGLNVSDYVRHELGLRGAPSDIEGLDRRVSLLERRLGRLEEMAGI